MECFAYVGDVIVGTHANYTIEEELNGDGRNGSLYIVVDDRGRRCVAKFFGGSTCVVPGGATPEQRAFKRFKKEASFLKLFDHPHIVRYIDECEDFHKNDTCSDRACLIIEMLSGPSAKQLILRRSLGYSQVLIVAMGAVSGLSEVHRHGVTHRDIHPGNIVLDDDRAKIVDFGCSVGAGITRKALYGEYERLAGSKHRAPEAINPDRATPKSDVFSLGLTILELCICRLMPAECEEWPFRSRWIEDACAIASRSSPDALIQLIRAMVDEVPARRPSSEAASIRLAEIAAGAVDSGVGAMPTARMTRRPQANSIACGIQDGRGRPSSGEVVAVAMGGLVGVKAGGAVGTSVADVVGDGPALIAKCEQLEAQRSVLRERAVAVVESEERLTIEEELMAIEHEISRTRNAIETRRTKGKVFGGLLGAIAGSLVTAAFVRKFDGGSDPHRGGE